MVRTSRPLVERMALVWHDWFATSNAGVGSQRLMLGQNNLFRSHGLGSFDQLLLSVTRDPAMLLWLSGTDNEKGSPNENYGREMMELFTLGAGRGYTERDVREQARALTGFRYDWDDDKGPVNFRYDRERHDTGDEADLRQARALRLEGLVPARRPQPEPPLVLRREALELLHPRRRPRRRRGAASSSSTSAAGFAVRPVVEAILRHPRLYNGPRMVKPPVVYLAGMLRAQRRGIDTDAWTWLSNQAGPAALLSAERRRLERRPLARHGLVPGPLGDRRLRPRAPPSSRPRRTARSIADEARRARARVLGHARR